MFSGMTNKRLILASSSPRRIALLKTLGYPFDVMSHDTEECVSHHVSPEDLVQRLALQKAEDVAQRVGNAVIIGADTIVLLNHCILGKPADEFDAHRMLSMLSDAEHEVLTGVCLVETPSKKKSLRFGRTQIKMRHISGEEINAYVKSGEPMDKAGAYAIQGSGSRFIEKITGSYSNVVCLPLELLKDMLDHFLND